MKGKSASHRYQPASAFDDATLAQKREYWRNKKREQRARRSEKAEVLRRDCRDKAGRPLALVVEPPYSLARKEIKVEDEEAVQRQNEKWPQCDSPQAPSSCYISATVSASESGTFASLSTNGTQNYNTSSVPGAAARNGRARSVGSSRVKSQPCVRHVSVSRPQRAHETLPTKQTVNSSTSLRLPQGGSNSAKTRDKMVLQIGTKSTLGQTQRNACVVNLQMLESEEEKAARRREQWKMKKREQRAKLAARLGKTPGRTHHTDVKMEGRAVPNSTPNCLPCHLPIKSPLNGSSQKQWNRAKFKRENPKPQIGCSLGQHMARSVPHAAAASFSRGVSRCKTPRQRFLEAQKVMNQRNSRAKLSLISGFGSRNVPRIDLNDTPEQVVAKQREYWRVKKREQRAKMSMEAKARLAEKDSFMRRVKRYQSILEEIRRSRNLSHISEGHMTSASETIGGFIKEDGTMTFSMSQNPGLFDEENPCGVSKNMTVTQPATGTKWRTAPSYRPVPRSLRLPRVKVSVPLSGASVSEASGPLVIKPVDPIKSTTVQHGVRGLTHPGIMHKPLVPGPSAGPDLGCCVRKMAVSRGLPSLSRVMFDPTLTDEERMAKKREYWRVKKREQRAARATRLKLGVFHARVNSAMQRRRASPQVAVNMEPLHPTEVETNTVHLNTDAIKQETEDEPTGDVNACSGEVVRPEVEPSSSALSAVDGPQPDVNPVLTAESQITTLQAVASMKKLLEETLSSVTDTQSLQVKTETTEESPEVEMKPSVSEYMNEQELNIKTDAPELAVSFSPGLEDESQEIPPPDVTCTFDRCSETSPEIVVSLCKMEADQEPISHTRNLRLRPRSAAPQVPPSRPAPAPAPAPAQQQQQHSQVKPKPKAQNWAMPMFNQSGGNSLHAKREYWKLMKRQQRARMRARKKEGQMYVQEQAPLEDFDDSEDNPLLTSCHDEWTSRIPDMDCALPLPALTPPDNPLSSMNLHPIEPLCQSPISGLSPGVLPQSPEHFGALPTDTAPLNNLVPPKRIAGESEEDFMKRKREYWRLKKKEQRARKANRDQTGTAGTTFNNKWRPIPPSQDLLTQRALGLTPEKDSQQLTSGSLDSAQASFTFPDNSTTAAHSEPEQDEDFISVALWRNCYLMDYDPLNQLLVCMVCGELQYSHSLEGVKTHIDQAHPQTMELEVLERQRLMDAWDKQFSQRERFFTSQLQQKSDAVTDADPN